MPRHDPPGTATRDTIRRKISASRLERTPDQRQADDLARDARVLELIGSLVPEGSIVACYLSRPGEPGTLSLVGQLADRYRVLAPRIGRLPDGGARRHPDWAWLSSPDELVEGLFGIPEPPGEGLGAEALGQADLVVAAAIGAGLDGSRIGTGGGWFDRALLHRRPGVPVVVLLNDDEVRPCPQEPHDQPVDWLVTPTRTIRTQTAWCEPRDGT